MIIKKCYMRSILPMILIFVSAHLSPLNASEDYESGEWDSYGGWKKIESRATGFFRVEDINGVWWFITPEGHGFISKGANAIWSAENECGKIMGQVRSMGLNTIGAWSRLAGLKSFRRHPMPYAILIDMVKTYAFSKGIDIKKESKLPDIFSEDLEKFMQANEKKLKAIIVPVADDPFFLGWWTDNELRWANEKNHILDTYLKLPATAPGRIKAEDFLIQQYGSPDLPTDENKLQDARDGFLEIAVRHYARITASVIKKYDKNHLIFGSRLFFTPFAWKNTMPERMGGFEAVARGAKGYWDVISINNYFDETPLERTRKLYNAFQGPILISEFNIKSANKDQWRAGEADWDKRARISVAGYKEQIPLLFAEPYIIGYHWFPCRNGRFPRDNNSRPGLVSYKGELREILASAFQELNPRVEEIHRSGNKNGN